MLKRILYLGYYIKELDRKRFRLFMRYTRRQTGKSTLHILLDMVTSSVRYNISLLEYFQFRFFEQQHTSRLTWAGTGFMYEYQLRMNPRGSREILSNKILFLKTYAPFVHHLYGSIEELRANPGLIHQLLQHPSGKVVLKSSAGQCGRGIEVAETRNLSPTALLAQLEAGGNDYAEAFVTQHPALQQLSPAGLNTIRIVTQLNPEGGVDWLGIRLRITVNSVVDNLAAGNMAAPVDPESGCVNGPAVFSDITQPPCTVHPITGVPITGFQLPFWPETLAMVKAAALVDTRNKSIGWDVAITANGPELIEGNHDWCKLLWQLPAQRGLKPLLESYL